MKAAGTFFFVAAVFCLSISAAAGQAPVISAAEPDQNGFLVHTVRSEYQAGQTKIKVLLPERLEQGRRYRVLYVLPVEAGDGEHWGNGLVEVRQSGVHDKYGLICVYPTFSHLPWYADHPTDPAIRQESYLLEVLVPFIDRTYPASRKPRDRLLVGFSKSGWGAFSLLLRHPATFGRAAAWDAPLMLDRPDRYGTGEIFGSQENFEQYRISALLRRMAAALDGPDRVIHFGYGDFREDHESAHRLMEELHIAHQYRDGPDREHSWHSGWLADGGLAWGRLTELRLTGTERRRQQDRAAAKQSHPLGHGPQVCFHGRRPPRPETDVYGICHRH